MGLLVKSKLFGHLRRTLRCRLGQSLVEFVLVIPIFLALVAGIFEVSRLYYVRLSIRDVTTQAARYATTGQRMVNPLTGQLLPRSASIASMVRVRADSLRITVDSISVTPANGGGPGEVVRVRVFYRHRFALAPLRGIVSRNPFAFSVATSMKNEPVF
jgi:hypothetical protein